MIVVLKPIPDGDLEAFFNLMNDPTLSPNTGSVPHPITREWAQERLNKKRACELAGVGADRGLYCEGTLVGNAGWFTNEEGAAEIGYAIHREWRGKGLATKAATLVLNLMKESGFNGAVYAQHFKDNPASGRVLEKLGFQFVRDVESQSAGRAAPSPARIMALDISDWKIE